MAGGGASPQDKRSLQSGLNTDPGQSRGWGRTEMCRPADRPDTAESRDTQRLQEQKKKNARALMTLRKTQHSFPTITLQNICCEKASAEA